MRPGSSLPTLAFALGACGLVLAAIGLTGRQAPTPRAHAEKITPVVPAVLPFEPIRVLATPLVLPESLAGQDMLGQLRFRAGFHLTSDDSRFGGLSGLEIDDAGGLTAISDRGFWFRAQIERDPAGRVSGFRDWGTGFIRDAEGAPLDGLAAIDAEGLTRLDNGLYAVSFERRHRVVTYDLDRFGPAAPAQSEIDIPGIAGLGENRGLEALASAGDELLTLAEQSGRTARGWRFVARANSWKGWSLSKGPIEAPTALDALPRDSRPGRDVDPDGASPGYLGILRTFAPVIGAEARMIFLPAGGFSEDSPGQSVRPVTIGVLRAPWPVDNFEAIAAISPPASAESAARPPGTGRAVQIFILSDDNFSRKQRTLLLVFDWIPPLSQSVTGGGQQ